MNWTADLVRDGVTWNQREETSTRLFVFLTHEDERRSASPDAESEKTG